ncbi:hypothetical protein M3Y95_00735300 [Aphelenchoides besseyi]|nr:hypothetical protein M3Y95_00735300 [Aphelenchoides besseyi]
MALLTRLQFALLLYLLVSDLVEQPIPLTELDQKHLSLLMQKADGFCPFVISPLLPLHIHELHEMPDYAEDRHRQLSYIDHGINFSIVHRKLKRYFVENFGESFEKFVDKMEQQLSFSHFFEIMFGQSNIEISHVGNIQKAILYFFLLMAVCTLWNFKGETGNPMDRLNTFCKTRFLIVNYAIGAPISHLKTPIDTQETAFFLIWCVLIGMVHFVSAVFSELLRRRQPTQLTFNFRIFRAGFVVYSIMSIIFTMVILSFVILPRTRLLLPIYSIMLVADALSLIMSLSKDIAAIFSDTDNEIYRFSAVVLSGSADFFESVFVSSAIYHGLFVRRRLVTIALCSYISFISNRLLSFDYPRFQSQSNAIT